MKKRVFKQLHKDIEARNKKGKLTYGKELFTHDGRNTLQDAYEEALDLVVYLLKMKMERKKHG